MLNEIIEELKKMDIEPSKIIETTDPETNDNIIELKDGWYITINPEGKYISLDRKLTTGELLEGVYVKNFKDLKKSLVRAIKKT